MNSFDQIRCGYCGRGFRSIASGLVRRHACPGSGKEPLLPPERPLAIELSECCERMAQLAEGSVDVIIADPPYSKKTHTTARRGITNFRERKGSEARTARVRDLGFAHWTHDDRLAAAFGFKRIVKRWVLVFTDDLGLTSWMEALAVAGLEYVRTGVWHKLGSTPQLTGDRPAQSCEFICIAHQTHPNGKPMQKHWNGRGKHAYWEVPIVLDLGHKGARLHTTQKPLVLMEALVRDFSDPGKLILDPCAGSGTTIVAAGRLGRSGLGLEQDPEHVVTAKRRIRGTRQQLTLLK